MSINCELHYMRNMVKSNQLCILHSTMKDIFQNYQRKKVFSQASIIAASFVFALSIHLVLFQSQTVSSLSANVLQAIPEKNEISEISALQAKIEGETLIIFPLKPLENVWEFSISIAYNPNSIDLEQETPVSSALSTSITNEPGLKQYLLSFENASTLQIDTPLLTIPLKKINYTVPQPINFIQANYSDTQNNIFYLSLEGIVY